MGAMMALEAVKHVARAGTGLRGALLIYDALHADVRRFATAAQPGCPVCGGAGARSG
jgi:molybdopterin/thiamine biosynthesis adenylyltransferase